LHERHLEYFEARPQSRSATQPWAASERRLTFPEGWEHLADLLPEDKWHRFHMFGGSSQVLALTLLAAAANADPTLQWLPGAEALGSSRASLFEVELAPHVLNERPHQTTIDWLVLGRYGVIAAEAKFTEKGFGTCRCEGRSRGACSSRVLQRPYWPTASTALGLCRDEASGRCPLSFVYQAVRNMAAASAIAASRRAAFLLLYDERNPFFAGACEWPGWASLLRDVSVSSVIAVRTLTWQDLLGRVRLEPTVMRWAEDKHGVTPTPLSTQDDG
jgi:hypothetical protein